VSATRRSFLGAVAGALIVPLVARAQTAAPVRRIGWLGGPTREAAQAFVQPFLQGLRELGWIEGQNLIIEWRFGGGQAERLPALAAETERAAEWIASVRARFSMAATIAWLTVSRSSP